MNILLNCPLCFTMTKNRKIPDFYKDALKTLDMLLKKKISHGIINKYFLFEDNSIFFKQISTCDINFVYDLVDSDGKITITMERDSLMFTVIN